MKLLGDVLDLLFRAITPFACVLVLLGALLSLNGCLHNVHPHEDPGYAPRGYDN